MNILLFNQDWFAEEFRAAGHRVITCGMRQHMEVRLGSPMRTFENILKMLPEDFYPDVVIVHDESGAFFFTGLEETDIPLIFLSVDIHHHHEIHKYLPHVFDAVYVVQKDYLQIFEKADSVLEWMPLWASEYIEPSVEKEHDAVFIGTLDRNLNPQRVDFFEKLKEQAPVLVTTGYFKEVYPRSEIVINQTVKGDLNFRVFEAMMSGSLLLTEEAPNGLEDLFVPGEHLEVYKKNDVEQAAERIHTLLSDRKRCREIGHAGRERIIKAHMPEHRAAVFLDRISRLKKTSSRRRFYAMVPMYLWLTHTLEKKDTFLSQAAIMHTLDVIDKGIQKREEINDDLALHLVWSCIEYDRIVRDGRGEKILNRLMEAYPVCSLPGLALAWRKLNEGKRSEAEGILEKLELPATDELFSKINRVMMDLINQTPKA